MLQAISASIVRGCAVGPASYVVSASDPKAVTAGNVLCTRMTHMLSFCQTVCTVADPGFANGGQGRAPKAPRGWSLGMGYPPAQCGRGLRRVNAPSPENFSILSLKMATFSAFWALFLQFIVHSSMDCLKRFRRQKPLLVEKLAVVCMQIALGDKGDKASVLETTL